jgi:hypothetical protein
MITVRTPPQQHVAYNPWEPHQTQPSFNPDSYNASGVIAAAPYATAYNSQPPHQQSYAATTNIPQPSDPYYASNHFGPTSASSSPPPINTTSAYAAPSNTSGVRGPRGPPTPVVMSPPSQMYNDNPPMYEDGPSRTPVQGKN